VSVLAFELPAALEATVPPEMRGVERDRVRLMVAERGVCPLVNARFDELPELLEPGDLLVVNVSATLPASVSGQRAGTCGREHVRVHFSTPTADRDDRWWIAELRSGDGSTPVHWVPGETIALGADGAAHLELIAPYEASDRLLLARLHPRVGVGDEETVPELLWRIGEPIRYGYVARRWPLAAYQNVYARIPGSAEMPSAGRPFTPEMLTRLVAGGIGVSPIVLHTGVASLEASEPPYPEYYRVPAPTASRVNQTRYDGGRVIAVGTTVVRALETVVDEHGTVHPGDGWTNTIITPDRTVRALDGLLTGWHEPEASHLAMLEAVAGRELLERSYAMALERGYLWHEFGDVHLVLR
jgi:S-adenosylmethionine:tRNA ribosyltransferase-isomerase